MTLWEQAGIVASNGKELTQETFKAQMAGTSGNHIMAPCRSGAPTPRALHRHLRPEVSLAQWDGETLVPVIEVFSGVDLVAGTELKPGP